MDLQTTKTLSAWMLAIALLSGGWMVGGAGAPAGAAEPAQESDTKPKAKPSSRTRGRAADKSKTKPEAKPVAPAPAEPEVPGDTTGGGKSGEPGTAADSPVGIPIVPKPAAPPEAIAVVTPASSGGAAPEVKPASPTEKVPGPAPDAKAGAGTEVKPGSQPEKQTGTPTAAPVSPRDMLTLENGSDIPVTTDPKKELRSSDRLRFRIAEDPSKSALPIIIQVSGLGEASFPVTRKSDIRVTLVVRGKTLGQVREELVKRLLDEYYHHATVELAVEDKADLIGKAQFFGEMSGTIPIMPDNPVKLSEAILQMRPPDSANLRRVKVHRIDPVSRQTTVLEINVDAINRDGQRDKDIVLHDGDRIEVRQKLFN